MHHGRQASKHLNGGDNLGGERVAPRFHPLPCCCASKGFLRATDARLPSQQMGTFVEKGEALGWRKVRTTDRNNWRIAPKREPPEGICLDAPDLKNEDPLFFHSLPPAAKGVVEVPYSPLLIR